MENNHFTEHKVVINTFKDGIVRGFLTASLGDGAEELLCPSGDYHLPETLAIRCLEDGGVRQISLADAKAVFFVDSFEGKGHRKDVRFHTQTATANAVWVRVEFHDGEALEGAIANTLRHLIEPGFFIVPTDPGGNNRSIYLLKSALKAYRILGVRNR